MAVILEAGHRNFTFREQHYIGAATDRQCSILKEFCSRGEMHSVAIRWVRVKQYCTAGVGWYKELRNGCAGVIGRG